MPSVSPDRKARSRARAERVMRCACGSPTTHKIKIGIPSRRGVGFRWERGCARCLDKLAWRLLADGASYVEVVATIDTV